MWQETHKQSQLHNDPLSKLCPRWQTAVYWSLPALLPSVCVMGGQIGPHDFSGESWGLRTSQPPGLFLGVWLWLLLSTGGLSVCSSWRVWREQIAAEITPWQQDTLFLPGNVGAGRAKGQKGREESLPHTRTHKQFTTNCNKNHPEGTLKISDSPEKIHCSAKRFWLFCIWHKQSCSHQVWRTYSGCAVNKGTRPGLNSASTVIIQLEWRQCPLLLAQAGHI